MTTVRDGAKVVAMLLTINDYARRIQRGRNTVARWVKAALDGATTLPEGATPWKDPETRRVYVIVPDTKDSP